MSHHDAQIAAAGLPDHFAWFGRVVAITPPGMAERAIELTAIVSPEEIEETLEPAGRIERRIRHATISRNPASPRGGIERPLIHSLVRIGEEVWKVSAIETMSEQYATLQLLRPEATEVGRRGYRTR